MRRCVKYRFKFCLMISLTPAPIPTRFLILIAFTYAELSIRHLLITNGSTNAKNQREENAISIYFENLEFFRENNVLIPKEMNDFVIKQVFSHDFVSSFTIKINDDPFVTWINSKSPNVRRINQNNILKKTFYPAGLYEIIWMCLFRIIIGSSTHQIILFEWREFRENAAIHWYQV